VIHFISVTGLKYTFVLVPEPIDMEILLLLLLLGNDCLVLRSSAGRMKAKSVPYGVTVAGDKNKIIGKIRSTLES
jgi:hypothetical protein